MVIQYDEYTKGHQINFQMVILYYMISPQLKMLKEHHV